MGVRGIAVSMFWNAGASSRFCRWGSQRSLKAAASRRTPEGLCGVRELAPAVRCWGLRCSVKAAACRRSPKGLCGVRELAPAVRCWGFALLRERGGLPPQCREV